MPLRKENQSVSTVVTIFTNKYGSYSPKIGGRKIMCQNPFPVFLRQRRRKKVPAAITLEGGGV